MKCIELNNGSITDIEENSLRKKMLDDVFLTDYKFTINDNNMLTYQCIIKLNNANNKTELFFVIYNKLNEEVGFKSYYIANGFYSLTTLNGKTVYINIYYNHGGYIGVDN